MKPPTNSVVVEQVQCPECGHRVNLRATPDSWKREGGSWKVGGYGPGAAAHCGLIIAKFRKSRSLIVLTAGNDTTRHWLECARSASFLKWAAKRQRAMSGSRMNPSSEAKPS